MSIETWIEEFYPIPAEKAETTVQALQMSLLKYQGLLPENLEKHEVELDCCTIYPIDESIDGHFNFDAETCALCYLATDHDWAKPLHVDCDKCPIKIHTGKSCDSDESSPYRIFSDKNDPGPMIEALKSALTKEHKPTGEENEH